MLTEYIKPITIWLHANPSWTYVFVFFLAFTESLAVIGTIVPGSVIMTAIGVLIGSGVMPLKPTFFSGILGAMLGDGLSFWVGYHYKDRLRVCWPFSRYPQILKHGEAFFNRHGGKSIVIGRFVGPVRSVIPVVAGMMNMSVRTYLIADVLSSLFWAPAYMLPGILVGAASMELAPKDATRFIAILLVAAVVIAFTFWLFHQSLFWISNRYSAWLDKIWQRAQQQNRRWSRWLQFQSEPNNHQPFVLVTLIAACLIAFSLFAYQSKILGNLTHWNQAIYYLLQSVRTPGWDKAMIAITFLGDKIVVIEFVLVLGLWLFIQRCRGLAVFWWANAIVVAGLIEIFKRLIQVTRPFGTHVLRAGYSFPSGHTTLAFAIFGVLAGIISWQSAITRRRWIIASYIALGSLIAFSRIYLGQHWLTDIIGSFFLGASCALITTLLLRHRQIKVPSTKQLLPVALSILVIFWGWNLHRHYTQTFSEVQPVVEHQNLSFMSWWQQQSPLLPLHRHNRLGQNDDSFNLQFAGDLSSLTDELQQKNWRLVTSQKFMTRLSRIAAEDKTQTLPFWPKLYDYQHPAAELTLKIPGSPMLILRFWQSNYIFSDSDKPLWIATLHYRILWHQRWLTHYDPTNIQLPSAMTRFQNTLSNRFIWRRIYYKTPELIELMLIRNK